MWRVEAAAELIAARPFLQRGRRVKLEVRSPIEGGHRHFCVRLRITGRPAGPRELPSMLNQTVIIHKGTGTVGHRGSITHVFLFGIITKIQTMPSKFLRQLVTFK